MPKSLSRGPLSNFVQAFVWFVALFLFVVVARMTGYNFDVETILGILNRYPNLNTLWNVGAAVCGIGIVLNISLGVFNLLPMPPFDGGTIVEAYIPALRPIFNSIRPYSFILILVLLNAGSSSQAFSAAFAPVNNFASALVLRAFGEDPKDYGVGPLN